MNEMLDQIFNLDLELFDIRSKKVYKQTLVSMLNAWANVSALEKGNVFMNRLLKAV
jgi:hypothetical protein